MDGHANKNTMFSKLLKRSSTMHICRGLKRPVVKIWMRNLVSKSHTWTKIKSVWKGK